jgi:hypothetical protein
MSCFTKHVQEDKYYCIDDFFGHHRYGYVKMTDEEKASEEPWHLLKYATLESRGGKRKVLDEDEFGKLPF